MSKIIDLSKYNTITDWSKVKNAVDGIIIRCGYRGYTSGKIAADAKAAEFATQCNAHGIPFGVYFMSQAITSQEGQQEADYACDFADKYGAALPVFIDSEDGDGTTKQVRADGLPKQVRTVIVRAFCDRVQERGRNSGVYASESWFVDRLDYDAIKQYFIWCAKYGANTGSKCTSVKLDKYDIHQYTSRGTVSGIFGNVDISDSFSDLLVRQPEPDMKKELDEQDAREKEKAEEKESDTYMFECPVLTPGMSGNAVLLWNTLLAGRGYDLGDSGKAGNLNDYFGDGVYIATLDYKKHVGISIGEKGDDGTVTKEVWQSMIAL